MFTVMEVRSIRGGHKRYVSFPSEDHKEHFGDANEKIFLPAELFGKQGMERYKQSFANCSVNPVALSLDQNKKW